jgi:hypothetical protein
MLYFAISSLGKQTALSATTLTPGIARHLLQAKDMDYTARP